MTNSERVAKCRKNKTKEEKELARAKNREAMAKKRSTLSDEQREILRNKNRIRMVEYRKIGKGIILEVYIRLGFEGRNEGILLFILIIYTIFSR